MSGNAKQRRVARHERELIELGRRKKAEVDTHAAELAGVRASYEAQLASLRAEHDEDLVKIQQRHEAAIESWARTTREYADQVEHLRAVLQRERDDRHAAQSALEEIRAGGLISKREHQAAVEQETARLRERLRRATEERLAPKKVVLEQLAADPKDGERKLRAALALQRSSFRALLAEEQHVNRTTLRQFCTSCIGEIDAALGDAQPKATEPTPASEATL